MILDHVTVVGKFENACKFDRCGVIEKGLKAFQCGLCRLEVGLLALNELVSSIIIHQKARIAVISHKMMVVFTIVIIIGHHFKNVNPEVFLKDGEWIHATLIERLQIEIFTLDDILCVEDIRRRVVEGQCRAQFVFR